MITKYIYIYIYSKYAIAYRINDRSWNEFIFKLLQTIRKCGNMRKIIIDFQLGFKAILMKQFFSNENITVHCTSKSNHTSNTDVNRLDSTVRTQRRPSFWPHGSSVSDGGERVLF